METTLDKFGRIVIPKKIRDNLGLTPGITIKIETAGKEVVLKPLLEESPVEFKDGVLVFTGKATGNIEDAVNIIRDKRVEKFYENTF